MTAQQISQWEVFPTSILKVKPLGEWYDVKKNLISKLWNKLLLKIPLKKGDIGWLNEMCSITNAFVYFGLPILPFWFTQEQWVTLLNLKNICSKFQVNSSVSLIQKSVLLHWANEIVNKSPYNWRHIAA